MPASLDDLIFEIGPDYAFSQITELFILVLLQFLQLLIAPEVLQLLQVDVGIVGLVFLDALAVVKEHLNRFECVQEYFRVLVERHQIAQLLHDSHLDHLFHVLVAAV